MSSEQKKKKRSVKENLIHALGILFGMLLIYEASADPYLRTWKTLAVTVGVLNLLLHGYFLLAKDNS